jgi:hypothetical protein
MNGKQLFALVLTSAVAAVVTVYVERWLDGKARF